MATWSVSSALPSENSPRTEVSSSRTARAGLRFDSGKIPPNVLSRSVYPYLGKKNNRVVLGPGIGRDAAIVRLGRRILVFSTDPITGAARHIGAHSVHVNANDIAVAGGVPVWFLCTILVPPGSKESELRDTMKEVNKEALKLGITVIGGHTEATPDLKHPIIAGFMIGEPKHGVILTADRAKQGSSILMTKTAGIEGTAVLAADHKDLLKRRGVDEKTIRKALLFSNKISVVAEALLASKLRGVTAMHDPTEGGVLNGLWELAEASGLGIEVNADRIPVAPETQVISKALGLDPLKLLGSGTLLVAVDPAKTGSILQTLRSHGVRAAEIARLTSKSEGRIMNRKGRRLRLAAVYRDELYEI